MNAVQMLTGARRLAADRVPHARRQAVLRRHLLPARRPLRQAGLSPRAARRSRAPIARARTRSRARRSSCASGLAQLSSFEARRPTAHPPRHAWRAPRSVCCSTATPTTAASAARRSSPTRRCSRCSCVNSRRPATSALRDAVTRTLHRMARGGIYDQLGGGFHRYSVDAHWLVPHFEKMLYDNAQLVPLYLDAYRRHAATRCYRDVAARDARLRAARDDASGRRLLLGAGRRQRGRGGQVLSSGRLEEIAAPARSRGGGDLLPLLPGRRGRELRRARPQRAQDHPQRQAHA